MEDNIKEKESYKYITISGTAQQFEQSITSAVLDGFEVELQWQFQTNYNKK